MRDLFKGWRRKVGCAALVMACVFMGLWVRSRFLEDDVRFRVAPHTVHAFHLFDGGLAWISMWEPSDGPRVMTDNGAASVLMLMDNQLYIEWQADPGRGSDSDAFQHLRWSWNLGGYRYGVQPTDQKTGVGSRVLLIPYASSVVCLTLFSAYLILWNASLRQRVLRGCF